MKLGAIYFATDESVAPDELARALEFHGFESLWVGDHSHIPVDLSTDGPPIDSRTGHKVPAHYARLLDPFLALTHAAAATTHLRLGTSICLVNERDVINTAKQVATLDHLSNGRFLFGVGAGWNDQEMRNHGADPTKRYELMKQKIAAMREIWTNDVASFDGDLVNFGPLMCWPKPVQNPYPPVLIGGNYRNFGRIIEYGDGWIPSTTVLPAAAFLTQIGELQRMARAAGRQTIPITALHVSNVDELDVGAGEFTDAQWREWDRAGVERAVLILPPHRDRALRLVERYARFSKR